MVPQPGLLRAHLQAHAAHCNPGFALGVLGYPTWLSETFLKIPFYNFLNEKGPYFGFSLIKDPTNLPFNFFYTCNISLLRSVIMAHGGFDTDFPMALYEDIEFGYRAMVQGLPGVLPLKLKLCREARTLHDNPLTLAQFFYRQRRSGYFAPLLAQKHPELSDHLSIRRADSITRAKPWFLAGAEIMWRIMEQVPFLIPGIVYMLASRWYYFQGMRQGLDDGLDSKQL
jgi:GT2 family glycosyltransferase